MVDIDDEIKNLSPQQRIKKLKELEEKNKKEIEKAQKLIKENEEELAIEEKVKSMRIPAEQEVDVTKLFKKGEETLEETVEKEKAKVSEEELKAQRDYLKSITTERIEERAQYLQNRVEERGYLTNDQMTEAHAMYEEIRERQHDFRQGSYKPINEAVEEQLDIAKGILKRIYKG